jgi:predicted phage terminase large subunit-like protein
MREGSKSAIINAAHKALAAQRRATPAQIEARDTTLAAFSQWAWSIVEPSTPLIWNWHLEAICQHLQALVEDKLGVNNLAISVPPGSGKSRIVSCMLPAWLWLKRPAWKGIFASGNPRVSLRDSMLTRTLIGSPQYRNKFGIGWEVSDDQDSKGLFSNTATGFRMATTSGSRTTGDRASGLIVDDPLDAAEAFSKAARVAVTGWWALAFGNRLSDLITGKRIIIAQRLHTEDLIGYVLGTERNFWEYLMVPMSFEPSRRFTTSLGWTDPRKKDGELMFPQRFPAHVVQQEKDRLGISGTAGQLQQRPAAAEGELFKRGCLQLLLPDALPKCSNVILSLDTAFSERQTADYSVAVVLGQFDRGTLILDLVRGRWAYPQLRQIASELAERWKPSAVLVENKASGQSLIQSLRQETALPIVPVEPDGDKIARAHVATPTWESRRVFAPAGAAWLDDFEAELYAFPKAPHDDQVDALVHGLRYLTASGGAAGLVSFYNNELKRIAQTTVALQDQPGVVITELQSPWH